MIRNLIFDFGGVLLDLRPDRCIEQFTQIGIPEISQMLSMAHQQGVLDEMERGQLTLAQFCDAMRAAHRGPLTGPAPTNRQIVQAYCSMADGVPAYKLDFLNQLSKEGYHVSALSNTNHVHWCYCQRYFIEAGYVPEQLFEHLWLSCDLQLVKPDPRIFARILELSGYDPAETLFIDDNPANCQVAEGFGIHSLCAPVRTDWTSLLRSSLK